MQVKFKFHCYLFGKLILRDILFSSDVLEKTQFFVVGDNRIQNPTLQTVDRF